MATHDMRVYLKKIWHFNTTAGGFSPIDTVFSHIKIPFSIDAFESLEERVHSLDISIKFKDRVESGLVKLLEMVHLDIPIRHVNIVTKITEILRYIATTINILPVTIQAVGRTIEKVHAEVNLHSLRMEANGYATLLRTVMEWDYDFAITPTLPLYVVDWDNSTITELDIIG